MPCIAGILYNLFKYPDMMIVAKEEGLTGVMDKTIENNINAYPSAVEQLVDVKNILTQNKHPVFDQSSDDDNDDDYENSGGDDDEDNSSYSDDNVMKYDLCHVLIPHIRIEAYWTLSSCFFIYVLEFLRKMSVNRSRVFLCTLKWIVAFRKK